MSEHTFIPHPWLTNPHAQTIYPALLRRRPRLALREQPLELPDGDVLRLVWGPMTNGPLVIILHGLGGQASSSYVLGLMRTLYDEHGLGSVVMQYRGAGGWRNRLDRFYHAADVDDLDQTVRAIRRWFPERPLALAGYSLGANIVLNWLGDMGAQAPIQVAAVASPPFDLHACAEHIDKGFARIYQWDLLRNLKRMVRRKFGTHPAPPTDLRLLRQIRTLYQFDDLLTAPLHGFGTAAAYYRQASCGQRLSGIERPTLIVHAEDDPFIPATSIPEPAKLRSAVALELSPRGGHVGFVAPAKAGGLRWLERRMARFIALAQH
ncbi:hydrolase [Alkalilimnicola ehrlichii]|uniref:Hydrolase n=1 Tax=Alkalilimnicola ehrlichii TaxID=351052 RepID=A0A3E0WYR9_9GAMM|nr:hydrolase [Alkalilimnicola ehrlichii]RFA30600.1 hydrolase [Alkalilimnicola ehrlichii]RFA38150.1 hydrolase [Alkalilimnicola ehrlichii]